jgi:hypothetical protein
MASTILWFRNSGRAARGIRHNCTAPKPALNMTITTYPITIGIRESRVIIVRYISARLAVDALLDPACRTVSPESGSMPNGTRLASCSPYTSADQFERFLIRGFLLATALAKIAGDIVHGT